MIENDFYINLDQNSQKALFETKNISKNSLIKKAEKAILDRSSNGFNDNQSAIILKAIKYPEVRKCLLEKSTQTRKKLFGSNVITMAPIELSSFCDSNCDFCGWRSKNKQSNRYRLSLTALKKQINVLLENSVSHIELASGDDIQFLKNSLFQYVKTSKELMNKTAPNNTLSICTTPLTSTHYQKLKTYGLDAVFNWQETYNKKLFNDVVTSGLKKYYLTDNFKINLEADGFLRRAHTQELVIKNEMQAGLGVMVGLHSDLSVDLFSLISHGRKLIQKYYRSMKPLVIGVPIFNSANYSNFKKSLPVDKNEFFPIITSLLFLSFPDKFAHVFSNCRVSPQSQLKSIQSSCSITSTQVSLVPGGYLKNKDLKDAFSKTLSLNKKSKIHSHEQFNHYTNSFEYFNKLFSENNINTTYNLEQKENIL